jgi:hypothetical protein
MEADALWGVRASDSAELRGHIKYLSQQELRTASVNREAWSGTHMVARAPRAARAARDKHPHCARALTMVRAYTGHTQARAHRGALQARGRAVWGRWHGHIGQ